MALTACDLWTGKVSSEGYGLLPGGKVYAHRDAWERANGPIPDGMTLDHLCRTGLCRNVEHLEVVTRGENVLRGNGFSGRNARKTECVRGHPYTDESTMVRPNGSRTCRICYRLVARARRRGEPIETFSPRTTRVFS